MALTVSLDDLGLTPERVYDISIRFNTLITAFENGAEQRRTKGLNRRAWGVEYRLEPTGADALADFFIARKGKFEGFCWTDPRTGITYPVRFDMDELAATSHYGKLIVYQVKLIELIGEVCS